MVWGTGCRSGGAQGLSAGGAPSGELPLLGLDVHHGAGDDVIAQQELAVLLQRALVALQVLLRQRRQRRLHRLSAAQGADSALSRHGARPCSRRRSYQDGGEGGDDVAMMWRRQVEEAGDTQDERV